MSIIVIERVAHRVLLGIRFWDMATNSPAAGTITVRGQMLDSNGKRHGRVRHATKTRSGVYAFFGLHSDEITKSQTVGDDGLRVAVDVSDPSRNFLPVSFTATAPHSGPFEIDVEASRAGLGAGHGIPLWSSPGRSTPPGLATIHARLVTGNAEKDPPGLPWAFVEVMSRKDGQWVPHASGISDERGVLALSMPYPTMPRAIATNGNPGRDPALRALTFDLQLRVFARVDLKARTGSEVPDLEAILAQPPARIGTDRDGAALSRADELFVQLRYGEAVVLRTETLNPPGAESHLRVIPVSP